jgi:hypothetical protein
MARTSSSLPRRTRGKGRAVARGDDLAICVLDTNPPFPYLLVHGKAASDEETAVDTLMKIGSIMSGRDLPDAARPAMEEKAAAEGRVTIRVTPYEFFKTTPIAVQQPKA